MKKVISLVMAVAIACGSMTTVAYAEGNLDDIINNNQVTTEQKVTNSTTTSNPSTNASSSREAKNNEFINGLNEASDLSANVEGASKITSRAKYAIAFVVQVIAKIVMAGLGLRVALDLAYIAIPILRNILANGHTGAPQGGAQGGMGSMGGFGGSMGGFGGSMGGFGGGYGMRGGMGSSIGNQQQHSSKFQLVSNAALNAVASETSPGPDGKTRTAFTIYIKDMVVVLVAVPVLFVLAITGVLSQLGLEIGNLLVNVISALKDMI